HPAPGTPRQGPSGTKARPLLVGLRHRSLGVRPPRETLPKFLPGYAKSPRRALGERPYFPRPHSRGQSALNGRPPPLCPQRQGEQGRPLIPRARRAARTGSRVRMSLTLTLSPLTQPV